jgi:hypothetical protein
METFRFAYSSLQLRVPIAGAILVVAQMYVRGSQGEDKLRPYRSQEAST